MYYAICHFGRGIEARVYGDTIEEVQALLEKASASFPDIEYSVVQSNIPGI